MKNVTALIALAGAASVASAQFTAYGDLTDWSNALGGNFVTESFDGLNSGDLNPGDPAFAINGDVLFTVEGGQGNAGDAFFANGEFHGELFPDSRHSAYVHTFNTPIFAFGQFFDGAASGLGLVIETTEGSVDIFDYYTGFEDGFMGFISDAPITEVRIIGSDADGGGAVGEIYDVPDMYYAFVPAPGSLALLGLGGLAMRRRR